MNKMESKISTGIKLIIGYHLLNILLWTIGQGGAVIAYDTIAGWGLQDPRDLIDPAIVEVNRGIGLADMIAIIPMFILAVTGLWRLKFYGAVASWLAFGWSIYWPVMFWSSQYFYAQNGINHQPLQIATIIIPAFFGIFAVWGSLYLFKNYKRLT